MTTEDRAIISDTAQISAEKVEPRKWVPVINGKRLDFRHYPTKALAQEVARNFAENGWDK